MEPTGLAPRTRMRQRLTRLYGAERGERAFADLAHILDAFPSQPRRRPLTGRFDEHDVVLIAYGDTFLPHALDTSSGADDRDRPGTPLAALRTFVARHVADVVSAVHILPFFPYSSDYGFSVIDYEQVNPELGSWADIEALGRDVELMIDVVVNHCSAEGPWFRAFLRGESPYDGYFIVVDPTTTDLRGITRPRTTPVLTRVETAHGPRSVWTTFSADQVDLNYASPDVLLRMVEVVLGYVRRGAMMLRMDAVGYLWKQPGTSCIHLPETHEIVKLFRDILNDVAPDVAIVTETNVPHADNISYFGDGHDEAQMVYQFPLAPLVLHALASGDAGPLATWAGSFEAPSDATTFFNFLASHDGIGVVPARGLLSDEQVGALADKVLAHGGQVSYKTNPDGSESPYELNATFFDILSDPNDPTEPWERKRDRFLCSQAIMLAMPGVPGIYVHSLLGSHNDAAGFARSGWKRDLNHERLVLDDVERRLADPSSEAARVLRGYRALLTTRRATPAFHPAAPREVLDLGPSVFALRRGPHAGQTVVALHNVGDVDATVDPAAVGPAGSRGMHDILTGEPIDTRSPIVLTPYQVRWLTGST